MKSGKSTCFSMVPFVPGSFYAKKPNAVEFKMPATPQKSVPARNKSSGTGIGRGRGKARNNKEIFPTNPLVIGLDPQHMVGEAKRCRR